MAALDARREQAREARASTRGASKHARRKQAPPSAQLAAETPSRELWVPVTQRRALRHASGTLHNEIHELAASAELAHRLLSQPVAFAPPPRVLVDHRHLFDQRHLS